MKTFKIDYQTMSIESQYHCDSITFQAENQIHAINQLLDFYKQMDDKVIAIDLIKTINK